MSTTATLPFVVTTHDPRIQAFKAASGPALRTSAKTFPYAKKFSPSNDTGILLNQVDAEYSRCNEHSHLLDAGLISAIREQAPTVEDFFNLTYKDLEIIMSSKYAGSRASELFLDYLASKLNITRDRGALDVTNPVDRNKTIQKILYPTKA